MAKFKKFVERQLHRLCIAHVHPSVTPLHRECVRHSITLRDTGVTVAHSVSQPLTQWNAILGIYMQTIVCMYIILWHSTIQVKSREVNCWFTELLRDFEDDERMLMSKISIPSESERTIHQDSTYPPDSLVGHPGMLLRDRTVPGKATKNVIRVSELNLLRRILDHSSENVTLCIHTIKAQLICQWHCFGDLDKCAFDRGIWALFDQEVPCE